MEWTQFIIFFLGVFGLFIWNRTESRADARHFDQETKEIRREMINIMREMVAESKDFHSRLCVIEEKRGK